MPNAGKGGKPKRRKLYRFFQGMRVLAYIINPVGSEGPDTPPDFESMSSLPNPNIDPELLENQGKVLAAGGGKESK